VENTNPHISQHKRDYQNLYSIHLGKEDAFYSHASETGSQN
jgi:hypothetical protein